MTCRMSFRLLSTVPMASLFMYIPIDYYKNSLVELGPLQPILLELSGFEEKYNNNVLILTSACLILVLSSALVPLKDQRGLIHSVK